MQSYDHIIIGSGINSLVCAALLARKGKRVCILERNPIAGGCICTEEITLPGFHHDVLSAWHPLFVTSPAYAELGNELAAFGLQYRNTDKPAAGLCSDGRSFILRTDRDANLAALAAEDAAILQAAMQQIESHAELIFGLLSRQLWRFSFLRLVVKSIRKAGINEFLQLCRDGLASARTWLRPVERNRPWQACIAPWVLHVGLGPESASSGMMAKVVLFTLQAAGMPVVRGGSYQLVAAFQKLIEQHGGEIYTDQDVCEILLKDGRATGVATRQGKRFECKHSIICNVTPGQLYESLLPSDAVPAALHQAAANYRFGRADMQIHLALDSRPQWSDPELNDVALIHVSDGLDALSKAVNEADRGLLPACPTIVVGQPCALDPSRAPEGKWILWIQLQELPAVIRGDAAGEIEVPDNGEWTDVVAGQYAERVLHCLGQHISNLVEITLGKAVLSPRDLQARNANLVGGDPYSGDCALDQNLLFRSGTPMRNHRTCIDNVFHIGASTHPGPGLAGGSGYLVANHL